jgi:hypothetical protein
MRFCSSRDLRAVPSAPPIDYEKYSTVRWFFVVLRGAAHGGTAAQLVDCVIPRVPVRQWVLSIPIPLRILFAANPDLLSPLATCFARRKTEHRESAATLDSKRPKCRRNIQHRGTERKTRKEKDERK